MESGVGKIRNFDPKIGRHGNVPWLMEEQIKDVAIMSQTEPPGQATTRNEQKQILASITNMGHKFKKDKYS